MKKADFSFRFTLVTFLISLVVAIYLSWKDGIKPGPWMLTAGLFFALLYFNEKQNNL